VWCLFVQWDAGCRVGRVCVVRVEFDSDYWGSVFTWTDSRCASALGAGQCSTSSAHDGSKTLEDCDAVENGGRSRGSEDGSGQCVTRVSSSVLNREGWGGYVVQWR
jgi:hypothetical protein